MPQKRKYTKRSEYWQKFQTKNLPLESLISQENTGPILAGDNYYVSTYAQASSAGTASYDRSSSRVNQGSSKRSQGVGSPYANIKEGILPYDFKSNGVDIRETVDLCQRAYANVPIFRNAIDIMSELANSAIHVEGGTEKSRKFVEKWFAKINLWDLKDQFFREYYRSGNVFLYRVDGKFTTKDFAKLNKIYGGEGLKPGQIPIRYILLNPYDVIATRSTSYKDGVYKKILSEYELEELREPKTEHDREILKNLPKEAREKIKKGTWSPNGIEITLDSTKLSSTFYKKQDYEPFAVPFGFPVLDDINWKLELKKVDQAISKTIENVILLITMGAEPEKGGINPENLSAARSLFQNESVGRVMVADYTTKAEFVIPDISKIIGPQKYQIVNEDIKEGLQNVIVGNDKFANTQVKAEIFLERLKEARLSFLNNFLQDQIKMVCQNLGFRDYPVARFEEIDIKDEVQFQRVVTRLLEIGIITPEQGIKAMKTGIYPDSKNLKEAQKEYVKEREEGLFNPLIGGVPMIESPESNETTGQPSAGRPTGTKEIKQTNTTRAEELYSRKEIQSIIYEVEDLYSHSKDRMNKKMKTKSLSKEREGMLMDLCKSVVSSREKKNWKREVTNCIKNFDKIESLLPISEILELSQKHELDLYPSSLLYHSNKKEV